MHRSKFFLALVAILSMPAGVLAADVTKFPTTAAYYGIQTKDPAAVISALDTFMASDCGKKMPAAVSLLQEHFNGQSETTHTVLFGYEKPSDIDVTNKIFQECPAALEFLTAFEQVGNETDQMLGRAVLSKGMGTDDQIFWVIRMKLERADEAEYTKVVDGMMEANRAAGLPVGSYGVVRLLAGATGDMTHFAYIGFPDFATYMQSMDSIEPGNNPAIGKFIKRAGELREITDSTINIRLKNYFN